MESTKSGKTTQRSKYLLIRVGDRWLITDVPANFQGFEVVGYLDKVDPEAARRARERYACLEHFGGDSESYGYATGLGWPSPARTT